MLALRWMVRFEELKGMVRKLQAMRLRFSFDAFKLNFIGFLNSIIKFILFLSKKDGNEIYVQVFFQNFLLNFVALRHCGIKLYSPPMFNILRYF